MNTGIIEKIVDNCTKLYPEKVAVQYGKITVSYSDILAFAKKIAASIQRNRADNSPVGIICTKNSNLVSAWLGGVLSGKLFFLIDGSWPFQRIEKVLKLVGCHLLLDTSENRQGDRRYQCDLKVVDWQDIISEDNSNYFEINLCDYDKPTYLLFTSGSTGEPRAVVNSLQSIDHFFQWYISRYGFDTHDRFSLLSGISHDPVIRDIVTPLLVGGRAVIPTSGDLSSPSNLSKFLISNQISIVHLTPQVGKILFELSQVDFRDGAVEQLYFGGDQLPLYLVEKCLSRIPGIQVSNFYGATETPQVMLYNDIDLEKLNNYCEIGLATAPIGMPIPGVQVSLEQEGGAECAKGEEGEIILQSRYLSLGYFEDKIEKGVGDDNSEQVVRVYKTGDYGKQLETGEIHCLGRRDRQVKIRGYRIEPVEIENVIRRLRNVKDVVVQKDLVSGELEAFLVCEGPAPDTFMVNTHLTGFLPPYIQINNVFRIDNIRLNPNGKLDYDYLKGFKLTQKNRVSTGTDQHQNKTIRTVLEVFQEILGIEEIDPAANLLELGCDSLRSLEIVENINKRLGAQIGTIELYECKTIRAIAEFIETGSIATMRSHWRANDVATILSRNKKNTPCSYMREDSLCQFLLTRLYVCKRRRLRRILDEIILKREGGAWFTITLRQLYKKYYDISIGDYTSFCFRVSNFKKTTTFGRYCDVTRTARFETANHPSNTISVHGIFYQKVLGFSKGLEIPRNRITIGNDVHIGHNSTFLYPGKEIGDGAIIGAGAVVNFDVPPYAVVAGNPGKIIRYRFDKETINELLSLKWWDYSLEELEPVRDEFLKPLDGKKVI